VISDAATAGDTKEFFVTKLFDVASLRFDCDRVAILLRLQLGGGPLARIDAKTRASHCFRRVNALTSFVRVVIAACVIRDVHDLVEKGVGCFSLGVFIQLPEVVARQQPDKDGLERRAPVVVLRDPLQRAALRHLETDALCEFRRKFDLRSHAGAFWFTRM
jgi:hypothetical protein